MYQWHKNSTNILGKNTKISIEMKGVIYSVKNLYLSKFCVYKRNQGMNHCVNRAKKQVT